jgi:hypothetical protein
MNCLLCVPLNWGLIGRPPPPTGDTPDDAKARLEFMKKSMATHDIQAVDDRGTKFRLQFDARIAAG